ncbi:hypothetical protein RHGRI_026156 [Rhododendron griersonianum]|uniref:DNA topoisomerase n=1 Tax=Rhododendron griersonianum TaxID=479676 RepID=A0AAV6IVA7_9ERIC|nr:hypothetical protein RHGRI_026156 [Rhododendron griersonianum]
MKAMSSLVEPNEDEALAVDARQEIDLKVGVAFTRFQTNYFHGKYGNLDSRVISYGPCQTPTLGFCVQRYLQITTFKPEKFWAVHPYIIHNGYELKLEWERNKLFDSNVAEMFQKLIMEDGVVEVTGISEKQESKTRPSGLNTVNLLKVASSALGIGPQLAMQLAERLYTQGFISYPRTESTAYPSSFEFRGILGALVSSPSWGSYAQSLLADGYLKPRSGTDAGDHPPITPIRSASEDMLGNDAWRLYQYVCQHFLGTVSPDCKFVRTTIEFSVGGEFLHIVGQHVTIKGYTCIMPWLAVKENNLPQFTKGEKVKISKVDLYEGETVPPDYLSESELISLMEKNGIGTDASIAVHINNICERNYVQVQAGRKLVPTALGISLIRGYQCIDPDLCLPDIRSFIEQQITLVAKGQADHCLVVQHVIQQFKRKFSYFVKQAPPTLPTYALGLDHFTPYPLGQCTATWFWTEILNSLLEEKPKRLILSIFNAIFSALLLSRKAQPRVCNSYEVCKDNCNFEFIIYNRRRMLVSRTDLSTGSEGIEVRVSDCFGEDLLGNADFVLKLYKELTCPLDNFELLIFSFPGPEGKTFPFCPYCYNSPPFEGIGSLFGASKAGGSVQLGKGAGMPCFLCPHPTCQHSLIAQGVCACPECNGTLVLDPVSAPKWRLFCNMCNCLVFLPEGAHRITTTEERCVECDSTIIEVDFNKKTTPLKDGTTLYSGCILCDELLHSLVEMKYGKSFSKRIGGRGRMRGKGRGGRGRGGRKPEDPKMSFRGF